MRKELSSIKEIKISFIYGSFASNKPKATSDIDLMIIGNPNVSILNAKIAKLEKRLKREINPTVYSYEEYETRKKAKSGFVLDLLNNQKIMLIGTEDDL
jgi:predicted nucleotidyltransferase